MIGNVSFDFVEEDATDLAQNLSSDSDSFSTTKTLIPREVLKSNTVEALLSQNEDLMARLKVTFRRLTTMEDEHRESLRLLEETKQQHAAISDQMLVWREKERIWKEKNDQLESQVEAFRRRFPDYLSLEEKVVRYKRHQEKLKTQIKPYIQELKTYAQSLVQETRGLHQELAKRERELYESENRVHELTAKIENDSNEALQREVQLSERFEADRENFEMQLSALRAENQTLQSKAEALDAALEKQDELENLTIALRRSKTEFAESLQERLQALQSSVHEQRSEAQRLNLQNENLKRLNEEANKEALEERSQRTQMAEQLESVRFLWESRSEEVEKLKVQVAALEKLNRELSQKMNQMRTDGK